MNSRTDRMLVALAALVVVTGAAHGQQNKLKVYISVDMEGISGLAVGAQMGGATGDYAYGRRMMTADVNAAVAAAFEAGATEVVVNDAHGSHANLLIDDLDRRVTLISGRPKPNGMVEGLDPSFDAAMFIGYHARGTTADAVQDHTYSGALLTVKLNGREVGEYGLNAALAGYYGVPVVFASGDRALAEQVREFVPGIEAVAVKEGIGRLAARMIHPAVAREKIAEGIKRALAKRASIQPIRLSNPVTLEVELGETNQVDAVLFVPGMKRLGGRAVSYTAPDMLAAYRVSRLVAMLAQ